MGSKRTRISLIILALLALGLAALSFLPAGVAPTFKGSPLTESSSTGPGAGNEAQVSTRLSIDFGDGRVKTFEVKPAGENLFQIMKEISSEERIKLGYETYSGLGELITEIGDKKNGAEDNKYWQFWINGFYAQVGASSYIVQPGDVIEWKFTNAEQ